MTLSSLPVAVTALPIGLAFGVILERAGLGDSRVIAGQLTGRDFTVVRVMFGAIVTAMLGVVWASTAGVVDAGAIAMPPTDVGGQLLGGIIFGGGFALAALCPGTACVAAASGRREGVTAVGGVLLGTLLTPVLWPAVGSAAATTAREGATLNADLGVPQWAVVLAIVILGALASAIARRVESPAAQRPWWTPRMTEVVTLTLAVAFMLVQWRPGPSPATLNTLAGEISREQDHVDPLDLATWIRERKTGLRVVDVREDVDSESYVIPGAEVVPLRRIASLNVGPSDVLVLYSDGGTHAAQAWVLLRAHGVADVHVLKDGLAAWEDEVMSPRFPQTQDDSAKTRFARARELAYYFGGRPRLIDATITGNATSPAPVRRRRRTC
ncbi:MAG: rhodanese-like domain-containing protein [Gemmatimonadaceae bacterium]